MAEPDFGALRAKLAEAQEELRLSADLAEQVDLHASAAKRKIGEARVEFDKLAADITRIVQPSTEMRRKR